MAVIRVRGVDIDALNERFTSASGKSPSTASIGRILFGKWGEEEVVVVRTSEFAWEINCHGGEAAVNQILSDLNASPKGTGCVEERREPFGRTTLNPANRPDGLHRAAVNPKNSEAIDAGPRPSLQMVSDTITAELLRCRSRRTAEYLLAQSEGSFGHFLRKMHNCQNVDQAIKLVDSVLQWQDFATHLTTPWKLAIVGQPNAGKSSLLNALIGYERAIVFDQPGTTRDRIEAELIIDGWPMLAIDTAGIRETTDDIEHAGVTAARTSISDCHICLLVVDSSVGWTARDSEIAATISSNTPSAVLLNKSDLTDSSPETLDQDAMKQFQVSATTGAGLDELLEWIPQAINPHVPAVTDPLPVVPAITAALVEFRKSFDLQHLQNLLSEWHAE